jgi:superfamily I DNA and/or RNA helicase
MVTASIFKKHFEEADHTIKGSLFTQYRMHPDIMNVINHFYEHRLACGIDDPNKERNHGLTIPSPEGLEFITPEKHAIWIDSSRDPLGQQHMEEQRGTSKVNFLEICIIVELLKKIDHECTRRGYSQEKRKSVGVISFYGKQIGEIRRQLKRHKFESLRIDVNTVDRFQGKEKPIVLVSLVRNKKTRHKSKHAFVAQFERINVAFSRAQELLVILGAKDMFFDYEVRLPYLDKPGNRVRRVYQDIINQLDPKGCFWPSERVISARDYRTIVEGNHHDSR